MTIRQPNHKKGKKKSEAEQIHELHKNMEKLGNTLMPGFDSSQFYINDKQFDFLYDTIFCKWFFEQSEKKQKWMLEEGVVTSETFLRKQQKRWWVGGRGSGKTNVLGKLIGQLFFNLPRALFNLVSFSFGQLESSVLPELRTSLAQMGIIEGVHWVYGQNTVPKEWKDSNGRFNASYYAPENTKRCMVFCNGFTIEFMSSEQDITATRGGNIDGLLVDEAAFLDSEFIRKMVIRIRANASKKIGKSPLHWLVACFTSAPTTLSGQWIWEKEEEAKRIPTQNFFCKSTAFDNLQGLGGPVKGLGYIQLLYDELDRAEYLVEVLNHKMSKPENSFYPTLSEKKHVIYVPKNKFGKYSDYDPKLPAHISFDFNKAFMCCVAAQENLRTKQLNIFDIAHVKWKEVDDLVDKFCERYSNHERKAVYIYGDPNGFKTYDAISKKNYYQVIIAQFEKHGWGCQLKATRANVEHDLKFLVIKRVLAEAGANTTRVRINAATCGALKISLLLAPRLIDGHKDKSSEKMNKSNRDKQELATHLSDAFDYLIYIFFASVVLLQGDKGDGKTTKGRGTLLSNVA